MDSVLLQLGANIRELRERRGLTQDELARLGKLTRTSVARLERGEQNPTLLTLAQISRVLEVRISTLVQDCGANS